MPHRIQISLVSQVAASRAVVVVAEPSRWMLPQELAECAGVRAGEVLEWFRAWLTGSDHPRAVAMRSGLPLLRGKDLACWCALGSACHADVLLELANRE